MRISKEVFLQHVRAYSSGDVIFREGEPGKEMFILVDGRVEITKSTSGSAAKTLITLQRGDIFGEMAVIDKKARAATATAIGPTKVLVLNEALFDATLEKNPDFARKIIKLLSDRLRRTNQLLQGALGANRQSLVMDALSEYASERGSNTFRGTRINIGEFVAWASRHIGIDEKDIRALVDQLIKRQILQTSALGKEEVLVARKPPAAPAAAGAAATPR